MFSDRLLYLPPNSFIENEEILSFSYEGEFNFRAAEGYSLIPLSWVNFSFLKSQLMLSPLWRLHFSKKNFAALFILEKQGIVSKKVSLLRISIFLEWVFNECLKRGFFSNRIRFDQGVVSPFLKSKSFLKASSLPSFLLFRNGFQLSLVFSLSEFLKICLMK